MSDRRLTNLDLIRAFAALIVCFSHFRWDKGSAPDSLSYILQYGSVGVEIFFVVSGFVIPLSLSHMGYRIGDFGTFMFSRFLRLYPAYLAAGVVSIALWYLGSLIPGSQGVLPTITLGQITSNCLLLCDFTGDHWLNPVFWTLAIEAQYYVIIALTMPWLLSVRRLNRMFALGAWIFAPLVTGYGPTVFTWTALFAIGIAAWLLKERRIGTLEFALTVLLAAAVHTVTKSWFGALAGTLTALAILYPSNLRLPVLAWIGTISYSLYLIHIPIGGRIANFAKHLPEAWWMPLASIAVALLLSITAAGIFFYSIERPSHNWARRFRRRRG